MQEVDILQIILRGYLMSDAYFVIGVKEDIVTLGNYVYGYKQISLEDALFVGRQGKLKGFINNKLVPCIHVGKQFNSEYYFCDGVLYRYWQGDYVTVNPRVREKFCDVYNVGNTLVIASNGKYWCRKSVLLEKGYNILNSLAFQLKDDRVCVLLQGVKLVNHGTVQAVFNELLWVSNDGIIDIYTTNDSRFESMSKEIKYVTSNSISVNDIKQRVRNCEIKSEMERFTVTLINNVIVIGNLEIDLGGQYEE